LCLNYGRGPTKLGVVPISDGAGKVAAIGEGITRVKQGDRVIGTFHPRWFWRNGPQRILWGKSRNALRRKAPAVRGSLD